MLVIYSLSDRRDRRQNATQVWRYACATWRRVTGESAVRRSASARSRTSHSKSPRRSRRRVAGGSCGGGGRLWLPGRVPSSRCSVDACRPSKWGRTASSTSSMAASSWTASSWTASSWTGGRLTRRAASGGGMPTAAACTMSSATIRATVVVLPVHGPPATTVKCRRTAVAAAMRWRLSGRR